ncbi:MAG: hypothetical protein ACXW2U_14595 [Telluria sp.]
MDQAKRDFSSGRLSGALFIRVPMSKSDWIVRLSGAKGDAGMLLDVRTLEPHVFRTLDSAAEAVERIGFSFDQLKLA